MYSNDIKNNITEVKGLDENDLEVKLGEMKSGKKKIGVYYGPQERAPKEEVQRELDTLKTHINKLKQNGDVIQIRYRFRSDKQEKECMRMDKRKS